MIYRAQCNDSLIRLLYCVRVFTYSCVQVSSSLYEHLNTRTHEHNFFKLYFFGNILIL